MGKPFYRAASYDPAQVNETKRSVPVAFSSETPCPSRDEQGEIDEILDHSPECVDMSRASGGLPLMLSHRDNDAKEQVGIIEDVTIGADRVMRGMARFGAGQLANDIFTDVKNGIRKTVSVGYERTGIVSSDTVNNRRSVRFRWLPLSVSVVPVPADINVGFGRNQNQPKENPMPEVITPPAATATGATVTNDPIPERTRSKEIRAAATEAINRMPHAAEAFRSLEAKALDDGMTVEQFNASLFRSLPAQKPAKQYTIAELSNGEADPTEYKLTRALKGIIEGNFNHDSVKGMEGELHQELQKRNRINTGVSSEGFQVPFDAPIRNRRSFQRDMTATGGLGTGGGFIPTQLVTPIIEVLRNRMVTDKMGIQTLAGLSGNIAIPRQTGAATAYSVAENAEITLSTQAIDQITLTPHRVGVTNKYSKQLILQSSPDVESFIRDDQMKQLALYLDKIILEGGGGGDEATGMLHTIGIQSVAFGAAATYAKIVEFETKLAQSNADVGSMAFATTPAVRGKLKTAPKIAGSVTPIFVWEDIANPDGMPVGTMNSYRAVASNQITGDKVVMANWGDIINGMWGGFDIVVNPFSEDTKGLVRITVAVFHDIAVRHAASIVWSSDSGAQ